MRKCGKPGMEICHTTCMLRCEMCAMFHRRGHVFFSRRGQDKELSCLEMMQGNNAQCKSSSINTPANIYGKTLNNTRKLECLIPTYTMQAIVSNKQPRGTAGRLGGVECTDPDRGREVYMIFNLAFRIGFDLRSIGYRSVYRIE